MAWSSGKSEEKSDEDRRIKRTTRLELEGDQGELASTHGSWGATGRLPESAFAALVGRSVGRSTGRTGRQAGRQARHYSGPCVRETILVQQALSIEGITALYAEWRRQANGSGSRLRTKSTVKLRKKLQLSSALSRVAARFAAMNCVRESPNLFPVALSTDAFPTSISCSAFLRSIGGGGGGFRHSMRSPRRDTSHFSNLPNKENVLFFIE